MALVAMTTADTVPFVSIRDPQAVLKDVPNDAKDPSKGSHKEVDRWEDGASVFQVAPLDVFLMGSIYDNASVLAAKQGSDEVGIHTQINKTNIDAVRFGLKAIPDDWKTKNGAVVSFTTEKAKVNGREYEAASVSVLNSLGINLIAEMADKIKSLSDVSVLEEKN